MHAQCIIILRNKILRRLIIQMDNNCRAISIQSHVVHGYVGNKAATFPLQLMGLDVDVVNTVQFATHTGYCKETGPVGTVLEGEDLGRILEALRVQTRLGVSNSYGYILTGYARNADTLSRLAEFIRKLKNSGRGKTIYLMDPVLGDNGKLYVKPDVIPIYQKELLPLADIITPNQYELQWLCNQKEDIRDPDNALTLMNQLHQQYGVSNIILTSLDLTKPGAEEATTLSLYGSVKERGSFRIDFPKRKLAFTGTGDLFAALILGLFHNLGASPTDELLSLARVCEQACTAMQKILSLTEIKANKMLKAEGNETPLDRLSFAEGRDYLELDMINSKSVILKMIENADSPIDYHAQISRISNQNK